MLTGKVLSALFADEFDCKKHNKPHNNNDCKQRNGKNEHHCNDADEGYAGDYLVEADGFAGDPEEACRTSYRFLQGKLI